MTLKLERTVLFGWAEPKHRNPLKEESFLWLGAEEEIKNRQKVQQMLFCKNLQCFIMEIGGAFLRIQGSTVGCFMGGLRTNQSLLMDGWSHMAYCCAQTSNYPLSSNFSNDYYPFFYIVLKQQKIKLNLIADNIFRQTPQRGDSQTVSSDEQHQHYLGTCWKYTL